MAVQGAVCVFGDPGRGKTAAVRMALSEVPAGWKVTWVPVPVRPSVAGMRRAVFDALALPGRFPHTSALADAVVAGALGEARVLVVDEAQRLPVPCLEYLQSRWDHPGTRITLVLCCAVLCCAGQAASGHCPGCRNWRRGLARGRKSRVWPERKWRP